MSNVNMFNNNNSQGSPKPRDEIQIESLEATPYSDGQRVRVDIQVTPFQERPNLLIALRDADGNLVEDLNVIATMHAEMDFTIHLRNLDDTSGDYTVEAELFYENRQPPQDKTSTTFSIPQADN